LRRAANREGHRAAADAAWRPPGRPAQRGRLTPACDPGACRIARGASLPSEPWPASPRPARPRRCRAVSASKLAKIHGLTTIGAGFAPVSATLGALWRGSVERDLGFCREWRAGAPPPRRQTDDFVQFASENRAHRANVPFPSS